MMLYGTSPGTAQLLRSQHRTSPVPDIRKSRNTWMLTAGLLVLIVISAVLTTVRPLAEWQVDSGLQHPAIAKLALDNFSFDNIKRRNRLPVAAFLPWPRVQWVGGRPCSTIFFGRATRRSSDSQGTITTN
ncbi:hypothetical protein HPB51_004733 [Rhipicephalus microplus]|uniref:Uncharacterized protein n=1 Tax=Rhipicephalus microplus TaxID=6941 RepID=A0A9J6DTI7_RHIMP|nr:hypothetical protein HPB51_004733 [Rhipicephalus microplus]